MMTLLIAAVCYAIGYGSVQPTLNTLVIASAPSNKRGAANSTFFSALDLGIGSGALIWGLLAPIISYSGICFFVLCLCYLQSFQSKYLF